MGTRYEVAPQEEEEVHEMGDRRSRVSSELCGFLSETGTAQANSSNSRNESVDDTDASPDETDVAQTTPKPARREVRYEYIETFQPEEDDPLVFENLDDQAEALLPSPDGDHDIIYLFLPYDLCHYVVKATLKFMIKTLDLQYAIEATVANMEEKPGPHKRLGNFFSRQWQRCPPKLAWQKMLLMWTFLTWCAFAGLCVPIVLLDDRTANLLRLRGIACNVRPYWQIFVLSLPLNIFGSLLVAASQFTRQVLMSPSRKTLDKAHKTGKSLTIALPSMANFRAASTIKKVIWVILTLLSVPLHFLLNSAFFAALAGHDAYQVVVSEQNFVGGVPAIIDHNGLKPFNKTSTMLSYMDNWPGLSELQDSISELQSNISSSKWHKYDRQDCVNKFSDDKIFINHRHLVMVTNYVGNENTTSISGIAGLSGVNYGTQRLVAICPDAYLNSTPGFTPTPNYGLYPEGHQAQHGAMCWPYFNGSSSNWPEHGLKNERFKHYNASIDIQLQYCLSEKVEEKCAVYMSPIIIYIAAVIIGAQALCMTLALIIARSTPLVLVGDVLASYLQRPDTFTKGEFFSKSTPGSNLYISHWRDFEIARQRVQHRRRMTRAEFQEMIWLWYAIFSIVLIVNMVVCISYGSTVVNQPGLFDFDTNPRRWFLGPIAIASASQVVLVLRDYFENVMATAIRAWDEFRQYARHRQGLRVSYPRSSAQNQQQAAYVLQMPLGVAIWHIIASAFIHWWISLYLTVSLIFVVRLDNSNLYPEFNAAPNPTLIAAFVNTFKAGRIVVDKALWLPLFFKSVAAIPVALFLLFAIIILGIFLLPLLLHAIAVGTMLITKESFSSSIVMMFGQGTDSLDVSTACHPPEEEGDISEKRIMWGVIRTPTDTDPGLCGFSSLPVMRKLEIRERIEIGGDEDTAEATAEQAGREEQGVDQENAAQIFLDVPQPTYAARRPGSVDSDTGDGRRSPRALDYHEPREDLSLLSDTVYSGHDGQRFSRRQS